MRVLSGVGAFAMGAHAARARSESGGRNRIVPPCLVPASEAEGWSVDGGFLRPVSEPSGVAATAPAPALAPCAAP